MAMYVRVWSVKKAEPEGMSKEQVEVWEDFIKLVRATGQCYIAVLAEDSERVMAISIWDNNGKADDEPGAKSGMDAINSVIESDEYKALGERVTDSWGQEMFSGSNSVDINFNGRLLAGSNLPYFTRPWEDHL